jgi:Flp pilus assembly protein TadG
MLIRSIQNSKLITHNFREARKGQAIIIVALMMATLLLFVGLGVDVANLMARRAKLQSAVDSAALSAAQTLYNNTNFTSTATTKAYQVLEANGVASNTLTLRLVTFPARNQVQLEATQVVDTFFMRLIPLWRTMEINARATSDLNAYAEMISKPYGIPGVVNELYLQVWGRWSHRRNGDAYSPQYINSTTGLNPDYPLMPYGYLYRIDVPPNFPSDHMYVEIFDPDSYNRPGTPPPYPTPRPGTPTPTPTITADMYASCLNPRPDPPSFSCTSNGTNDNPAMKPNAFPSGRPAFWRVDEYRTPYDQAAGGSYNDAYATTTQYTLWHFNTRITSAFDDPSVISDQPGGAYIARYTIKTTQTVATDLSWYRPPGFDVLLRDVNGNDLYEREQNGGMYFYLYVQGTDGSSENNFDLRVGPPQATYNCSTPCYVNQQYLSGVADWVDGGARIFAKRALPLNLNNGDSYPLVFTQVSKYAAGQTLGIRHFDQDCNNGCGSTMQYQMSVCNCAYPLTDSRCWVNIGTGYVGPNDGWNYVPASPGTPFPDPEPVRIPYEGTPEYNQFFGATGQCSTSWLRIASNPSYEQDSTVWEMPYIRPRIIK